MRLNRRTKKTSHLVVGGLAEMAKEVVLISSRSKISEPKIASRLTGGGKALVRRQASERAKLCCLLNPLYHITHFLLSSNVLLKTYINLRINSNILLNLGV